MPVRFQCTRCAKTLQIARRKIGTQVDCPVCGEPVVVPAESESRAEGHKHDTPPLAESNGDALDASSYSDIDGLLDRRVRITPRRKKPRSRSTSAPAARVEEKVEDDVSLAQLADLFLVSRRAVYAAAALMAVAAVVAFGIGFMGGWVSAELRASPAAPQQAANTTP